MAENVILKTQILLRNDIAANWTAANPVLGQGEVGLETDTKKLKVGDGTTAWNSLDYYVEDVIKDLSGLIQVPTITQPTYTNLKAKATYSAGLELGSTITHLGWTADSTPGYYSLGYYDVTNDKNVVPTGENDKENKESGVTRSYTVKYNGTALNENAEDSTSNKTITPITIDSTNSKTYATITGEMTWTDDTTRKPINNIGKLSGSPITASATPITQTANLILTGYREGCFYGCFNEAKDGTSFSNADIRGLNKSGRAYTKGHTLTLSVPAGTASIVIACPKKNKPDAEGGVACAGPSYVLNTTVNAPMTELYGTDKIKGTVTVSGANNSAAFESEYNYWIYTPANAYSSPASLTITLG